MEKCRKCENIIDCKPLGACWCKEYPKIPISKSSDRCLCKNCLEAAFAETVNHSEAPLTQDIMRSIADSFATDQPQENMDYVINQDGLLQFTKWYLIKRGYCCDNGCVNCPY